MPSRYPSVPFSLGHIVATPGAMEAMEQAGQPATEFLARHLRKDWGDLPEEDHDANEEAIEDEGRILSAYHTSEGVKLWVITEADRTATTILLPEEY